MTERAVIFGSEKNLFGIVTLPAKVKSFFGLVMMNAGMLPHLGPNRLNVKIAHYFANKGIPSIRFDFSGLGESGHSEQQIPLNTLRTQELKTAIAALEGHSQTSKFILIGFCSGARDALEACSHLPQVIGLTNFEGVGIRNTRFFMSRVFSIQKWIRLLTGKSYALQKAFHRKNSSYPTNTLQVRHPKGTSDLVQKLNDMLRKGVKVLFCYREGNEIRYAYQLHREGERIKGLHLNANLTVEFIPYADHIFTAKASHSCLLKVLEEWIAREFLQTQEI